MHQAIAMTLQLTLPQDQQAELERRAAVAGIEPAEYVLQVVQERLKEPERTPRRKMPYKKWKRLFDKWVKSQVSHNPNFDDSRESIYP